MSDLPERLKRDAAALEELERKRSENRMSPADWDEERASSHADSRIWKRIFSVIRSLWMRIWFRCGAGSGRSKERGRSRLQY